MMDEERQPENSAPEGEDRRGWIVEGRVQGVGFRWWSTQRARSLGLRGTVRNRSDGTVELHAAGPAEALGRLEADLRRGPRTARVDGLRPIPSEGRLPEGFRILR